MKFLEKLKAKLIDQNFKKGAIKATAIAVLATAVVTFAACNKTGQTPGSGTNNGGGTQPGPDTSYTASQILEENTAYKNLNLTNAVFDEIQQNVAKQFNVEKDKVEIVDMHFDKQNTNRATVVAKIGGEKVVTASYQNQKIAELRGANKKDLVLEEAGYTADQKVAKSQRDEVDAKFTQAVQKILDEIKEIENITPERVNEIFAGISYSKLSSSPTDGYDFAVVSGVREDRTVVVFTGKNGKFEDHVLSVDGKENMTNEEILAAIKSGTGFSKTTRTIDPSKKYEAPALEENPVVETITIGEIFDQNFSNINFSADVESAFQNIYSRRFSGIETQTLFFTQEGQAVTIYVNLNINNGALMKVKFDSNVDLTQFNTDLKAKILEQAGYNESDKINKADSNSAKENIQAVIDTYESQISQVGGLSNAKVKRESIITSTEDKINQSAFGAKLCEGKEVIATYVGALGAKQLNDHFGTGYVKGFDTATLYKENGQVKIYKTRVIVPYYNNDSNKDSYNRYVEKSTFYLVDETTEVVNNPVVANENGKKAEHNISFESKNTQFVDIASSAISQWLKNEEDSLSR